MVSFNERKVHGRVVVVKIMASFNRAGRICLEFAISQWERVLFNDGRSRHFGTKTSTLRPIKHRQPQFYDPAQEFLLSLSCIHLRRCEFGRPRRREAAIRAVESGSARASAAEKRPKPGDSGCVVEYREQVRDLDTEFRLQQVYLKPEHQTRVAASEREFQTKMSAMYMPMGDADEETVTKLKAEMLGRIQYTFELRKEAAEAEHAAKVAIEESKIALLGERDQGILAEADSLGLTQDYAPIIAKPIEGEITDQEKRWNDRELKEVARPKRWALTTLGLALPV